MKIIIAALGILIIFGSFYNFYFYSFPFPYNQEKLGQLGDFIGGNLNPVLTFISTLILINTVSLQRKANKLAVESYNLTKREADIAREESKKARTAIESQNRLVKLQFFESSYFNLLKMANEEVKSIKIQSKTLLEGAKAFEAIEHKFMELRKKGIPPNIIFEKLDDRYGNFCFETIRNYSIVFKFINENSPSEVRENYISIAISLIPVQVLYVLCIAKNHSDWKIIEHYDSCGVFKKNGITNLLSGYK